MDLKKLNKNKSRSKRILSVEKEKIYQELLALHDELILQIELIPKPCWGRNARSILRSKDWRNLRDKISQKAKLRCEICGQKDKHNMVHCHEVWSYDEKKGIQKLINLKAVCQPCHEVIHFGRTQIWGDQISAMNRFLKINKLDKDVFELIREALRKRWASRNKIKWKLNVDLLQTFDIDLKELKIVRNGKGKYLYKDPLKLLKSKKHKL